MSSGREITRRSFMATCTVVAATAATGFVVAPHSAQADVLRPPGALAEPEFFARCIHCYRCISACPTDVLVPMHLEEGVLQARSPTLDFSEASCTYCDLCRQVCPTGCIGPSDPNDTAQGRIGVAVVIRENCLAFIDGSCGICAQRCPYEAISLDTFNRPVVDAGLCNGCGECEAICPAHVLRAFNGNRTRGIEVVTERRYQEVWASSDAE
ncbi:MAG: 4Fe-4S dicluster domain-containing protein [Coriobacteriales bacterium]|jgi:ferredoxin-type protein NapG|nr:4Fe-4S dicluster domain-containing protein [Coriobacteriales bacterium]